VTPSPVLAFQDKLTHVAMIDLIAESKHMYRGFVPRKGQVVAINNGPLRVFIFLDIKTLHTHTNRWRYNER